MKRITMTMLATAMSLAPAAAEDTRRELGPHVHGHGTLNIAIERTRVAMELEVPGMDIVGFEHAAETGEQKAKVENAGKLLAEPLKLFRMPAAAACKVAEAKVEIETEHEADEKEAGTHSEADDHDAHSGHNEFHVTYALDCAKPVALTAIEFDYFKSFGAANGLTVNVVTAKAQNSYEVTRDRPTLDLGGMM